MKFSGFVKTSLIDYPDTLASVVYLPMCNFNCSYCHNKDLVEGALGHIDQSEIFRHLDKRKNIVDGIVITGGETTIHDGLMPFLRKLRAFDIKVKLDTNGYRPDILKKILKEELIDYIAMDIKNSKKAYLDTISLDKMNFDNIIESIEVIKASGIQYEFRTTLMKEFHTADDITSIGALLHLSKKFVLQQYEYSKKQVKDISYTFFPVEEMNEIKNKLQETYSIEEIEVRGRF